jgi:hypothetical protein
MGNGIVGIIVGAMCLALISASALAIGVSPPRIILDGVMRGTHSQEQVMLSGIAAGQQVSLRLDGNMADWIKLGEGPTFFFTDAKSMPLTIDVDVPATAANGFYNATLTILALPAANTKSSGAESTVAAGVTVFVSARVTGDQIRDFTITKTAIPVVEEGSPVVILFTIKNNGNVEAAPTWVHMNVFDKLRKTLVLSRDALSIGPVAPHTEATKAAAIVNTLSKEQYWVSITAYDGDKLIYETQAPIEVVEKGSKLKSGLLHSIDAPSTVEPGEIVKIVGRFENTGEVPVSASLKTEFYEGDKLIQVMESNATLVASGTKDDLTTYYMPPEGGTYTVKGFVQYDDKKTAVKDASFKVGTTGLPIIPLASGFVASVVGIALLAMLRTRKHKTTTIPEQCHSEYPTDIRDSDPKEDI